MTSPVMVLTELTPISTASAPRLSTVFGSSRYLFSSHCHLTLCDALVRGGEVKFRMSVESVYRIL